MGILVGRCGDTRLIEGHARHVRLECLRCMPAGCILMVALPICRNGWD